MTSTELQLKFVCVASFVLRFNSRTATAAAIIGLFLIFYNLKDLDCIGVLFLCEFCEFLLLTLVSYIVVSLLTVFIGFEKVFFLFVKSFQFQPNAFFDILCCPFVRKLLVNLSIASFY